MLDRKNIHNEHLQDVIRTIDVLLETLGAVHQEDPRYPVYQKLWAQRARFQRQFNQMK